MGPPGAGKGVLLKLLGGVYECSHGRIFVPPHLRVFHVAKAAEMLGGSVCENLFFGLLQPGQRAADLDRATLARGWRICERLGFPAGLMRLAKGIDQETATGRTLTYLSRSDRKLIHLARAFICNPEVLVVHTPGIDLDEGTKLKVISTLRTFVECRGVEMDPATLGVRRPRTCVFSTSDGADARYVDEMLYCRERGISTTRA